MVSLFWLRSPLMGLHVGNNLARQSPCDGGEEPFFSNLESFCFPEAALRIGRKRPDLLKNVDLPPERRDHGGIEQLDCEGMYEWSHSMIHVDTDNFETAYSNRLAHVGCKSTAYANAWLILWLIIWVCYCRLVSLSPTKRFLHEVALCSTCDIYM